MSAVLTSDRSLESNFNRYSKKCLGYRIDDFIDAIDEGKQLNVTCSLRHDPPQTDSATVISTGRHMRCLQMPATGELVSRLLRSESVIDIEIV